MIKYYITTRTLTDMNQKLKANLKDESKKLNNEIESKDLQKS